MCHSNKSITSNKWINSEYHAPLQRVGLNFCVFLFVIPYLLLWELLLLSPFWILSFFPEIYLAHLVRNSDHMRANRHTQPTARLSDFTFLFPLNTKTTSLEQDHFNQNLKWRRNKHPNHELPINELGELSQSIASKSNLAPSLFGYFHLKLFATSLAIVCICLM